MTFDTTRWSLILKAQDLADVNSRNAMGELCTIYWRPLYVYLRAKGYDVEESKDLTQEFFTRLLEKDFLKSIDERKGRFRSFLLASMNYFLINEHQRKNAAKRSPERGTVSIDTDAGETSYLALASTSTTPDVAYDRQWALAIMEQSLADLRDQYESTGKATRYEVLKPYVTFDEERTPYAKLATKMKTSKGAIRIAVHRLRAEYGEKIKEHIAQTVEDPAEVKQEIRYLLSILSIE